MKTDRISQLAETVGAQRSAPVGPREVVAFQVAFDGSTEIELADGTRYIAPKESHFLDLVADLTGRDGFAVGRLNICRASGSRIVFREAGRP